MPLEALMARLQLDVRYLRAGRPDLSSLVGRSKRAVQGSGDFFAPGWLVAGAKWVGRAVTKAASARSLKCPSSSKGIMDASGGASLRINESPYQLAAPVPLNCRASPRADAPRSLGICGQRDRAAESVNEAIKDKNMITTGDILCHPESAARRNLHSPRGRQIRTAAASAVCHESRRPRTAAFRLASFHPEPAHRTAFAPRGDFDPDARAGSGVRYRRAFPASENLSSENRCEHARS